MLVISPGHLFSSKFSAFLVTMNTMSRAVGRNSTLLGPRNDFFDPCMTPSAPDGQESTTLHQVFHN